MNQQVSLVIVSWLAVASVSAALECGDANLDQSIDMIDALIVAQEACSGDRLIGRQRCLADVDADGRVSVLDTLQIAQFTVGGALPTACACAPRWHLVDTGGAPARAGHSISFDPFGSVMVMFGGRDALGRRDDVWKWYGVDWTPKPAAPRPTPRDGHTQVFDLFEGVTFVSGGFDDLGASGESWIWHGGAWSPDVALPAPAPAPAPRGDAAMAYDPTRRVSVLFGGATAAMTSAETWEHDGQGWQAIASIGPSARRGHAMAHDRARGVTLCFGGVDSLGMRLGDTWQWDGIVWTQVASIGPSPRIGAAMTSDDYRGRVVLFGGDDSAPSSETWEWDGVIWNSMTPSSAPPARREHAMAYDSEGAQIFLFGGENATTILGDTWEYR